MLCASTRRPPARRTLARLVAGSVAASVAGAVVIGAGSAAWADSSPGATCPPPPSSGTKPVCRLAGDNRIGTAITISHQEFPTDHTAGAAILTATYDFPDAMSAGPLGKLYNAPVLLTEPGQLTPATLQEIQRTLPATTSGATGTTQMGCATPAASSSGSPSGSGGSPSGPPTTASTVYVIGGYNAIAKVIDDTLNSNGFNVVRVSGRNRFATSVNVAACEGNPSTVFLATGDIFADALASGPAAAQNKGAVLLTDGKVMPPEVHEYLASLSNPTVWAVGEGAKEAAQSDNVSASPLVGGDRFATAALVASQFFPQPALVGIATGRDFPDALAGGAFMGVENGPVLLTDTDSLQSADGLYLGQRHQTVTEAFLFGGVGVLHPRVADQVRSVINQ
jgi:putative cell wall-binding protein